jgi:cysteine desulfurase/selenocysteine lyase
MAPFFTGGGMIGRVEHDRATWADLPDKFEAGTPAIAEAVGLGAAIDYLTDVGMEAIWAHEQTLASYALQRLSALPGVRVIGPAAESRSGVIAFTVESVHPHDLAQILDGEGVAIRAGYHCAQPLHQFLGLSPTARASFYLYNTCDEVDRLVEGVRKAQNLLAPSR